MSLSNLAETYDTSYFSTNCSTSPDNNQFTPKKGSIFFMGDHNTHRMMTSNKTRLTVAISDINISEGLSFNLS